MTDHKKTPAPEEKGDPCEDCGVPMAIAPALGAYCDNPECLEKKLPQEERIRLGLERALKLFGLPKSPQPVDHPNPSLVNALRKEIEARRDDAKARGDATSLCCQSTFRDGQVDAFEQALAIISAAPAAPEAIGQGLRDAATKASAWIAKWQHSHCGLDTVGEVAHSVECQEAGEILAALSRSLEAPATCAGSGQVNRNFSEKTQVEAPAPLAPEAPSILELAEIQAQDRASRTAAPQASNARDRIIGEQAKEIVRLAWENARLSKIEGAAHALTATYWQQEGWAVYRIHEFDPLLVYFGYQTAEEQKKLREWEAAGFPDPNPFQKQSDAAAPTAKPEGT